MGKANPNANAPPASQPSGNAHDLGRHSPAPAQYPPPPAYPPPPPPATYPPAQPYPPPAAEDGVKETSTQGAYPPATGYPAMKPEAYPPPGEPVAYPPPNPNPAASSRPVAYPPPSGNTPPQFMPYSSPATTGATPLNLGQVGRPWASGLYDFDQDNTNAMMTAFFPCVTFGQIAEILDEGQTSCTLGTVMYLLLMPVLACSIIGSTYRTKLRLKYNLVQAPAEDWVLHLFCPCCSLCQEYREIQAKGINPSLGWLGNLALQQEMNSAPAVQKMNR